MNRRILHWFLPATITAVGLIFALLNTNTLQLSQAFLTFTPTQVTALTVVLIGGSLVAGLRLYYVASDSGHHVSMRASMAAVAIGQLAGALTFQFFGQIAGRSFYMRRRGVELPANIAMAGYERVVAFAVSASFALAGALYLFGQIILDTADGGLGLLKTVIGLAVVAVAGFAGSWGRRAVGVARAHMTLENALRIGRIVLLTATIQSITAIAYVSAALFIFPGVPVVSVIAASGIVMFASAIPISLSGWGVREVSAVYALSAINVPPAAAIAVAIMIGALSLFVMALIAAAIALIPETRSTSSQSTSPAKFDITSAIVWAIALISAMLVTVQIHAPTATGFININPADPFVILGAMVLAYEIYKNGKPAWLVPALHWHLLSCAAAIWFGIGVAFMRFGVTDWALYNKGFGFLLLLCYFATGALIVLHAAEGRRLLLRTFVICTFAAAIFDVIFLSLAVHHVTLPYAFWHMPFEGFTQNRNAFAFEILLAICCVQYLPERMRGVAIGVFAVALFYCGSRAGYLAAIVLAMLALRVSWRQAPTVILTIAVLMLATVPIRMGSPLASGETLATSVYTNLSITELSAKQHVQTVFDGIALFFEHPILGSGIGRYLQDQNGALQIHSTPVWLLAEIGLIGFAAFAALAIAVLRTANLATLAIIGVFAVMSLAHELLYQRALWLVLGALLTHQYYARRPVALDKIEPDVQVQNNPC